MPKPQLLVVFKLKKRLLLPRLKWTLRMVHTHSKTIFLFHITRPRVSVQLNDVQLSWNLKEIQCAGEFYFIKTHRDCNGMSCKRWPNKTNQLVHAVIRLDPPINPSPKEWYCLIHSLCHAMIVWHSECWKICFPTKVLIKPRFSFRLTHLKASSVCFEHETISAEVSSYHLP